MQTKQEILKKISDIEQQLKPLREKLLEIIGEEEKVVEEKVQRCNANKDKFLPEELVFAATATCNCGAGLAYPKNIGIKGAWYCSDILLGKALPAKQEGSKVHDSSFPFSFYDIKSEGQPSANGQTTRPKEPNVQECDATDA